MHPFPSRYAPMLIAGTLAIYFSVFLFLNLHRLWGFGFSAGDLGVFQQVVANMAEHGSPSYSLMYPYHSDANWLGFHFSLLTLLVMTPLYMLFPCPELFSVVHVLGMTIAAVPVYASCRALDARPREAFIWMLLFLLNPFQLYAIMFSYQEYSLATPLMALGLYGLVSQRFRLLVLSCAGLALSKEHLGLAVAGFGVAWGWKYREGFRATQLITAGIGVFLLVMLVIMPALKGDQHYMTKAAEYPPELIFDRYQWLNKPLQQAIAVFPDFFLTEQTLHFTLLLMLPLLLAFGSLLLLLPIAADIALIYLSEHDLTRSFGLYYTSLVIPALVIASCATYYRIKRTGWLRRMPVEVPLLVMLAVTALTLPYYPFARLSHNIYLFSDAEMDWAREGKLANIIDKLPKDSALIVADELAPLLPPRKELYSLKAGIRTNEVIIIRLNPRAFRLTASPISTTPPLLVKSLLDAPYWGIAQWEDPYLVLSPEARGKDAAPREVIELRAREIFEMLKAAQEMQNFREAD